MEATDAARKPGPAAVRQRWPIVAAIAVAIPMCLMLVHVLQVRHLRGAASAIGVGDTRAQVVQFLGVPRVTYSTGFPAAGGAATVWGSCYGGLLNSLRVNLDLCVYGACRASPLLLRRYQAFGAQTTNDWPVIVEFDKGGTVVAVRQ